MLSYKLINFPPRKIFKFANGNQPTTVEILLGMLYKTRERVKNGFVVDRHFADGIIFSLMGDNL